MSIQRIRKTIENRSVTLKGDAIRYNDVDAMDTWYS